MKEKNLVLGTIVISTAVLLLLIAVKLVPGVDKPDQGKKDDNTAAQKNTLIKTGVAKRIKDIAALNKGDSSGSDSDVKIQKLIDELSSLSAKQPMIPQTEGIIRELCDIGDAVIPAIRKILSSDANASIKAPAARVLAQIGSAESVAALVDYIEAESDPVCKDLYIRSIQAVDKADASPALIKALESSRDIYFSSEIKQAIARTGTEETVKQIVEACRSQNGMNAQTANLLGALSIVRQPETVPALVNIAANDQNPQIRKSALQALAGMGYPNATQSLAEMYKSEQNADRKPMILDAIAKVNNKESLAILQDIYNNKGNPEDLRKVAARAIFTIKNGVPPAE